MAQTLSTLSIISFAVAGISLVLSLFFWFFFKIPTVIGDLSGRTARKSIARMRAANEKTGNKSYKESKTNVARGKLTDTIKNSGKLKKNAVKDDDRPETGLLTENQAKEVSSEATGLLNDEKDETTGLLVDEDATAPLDSPIQNTEKRKGGKKLKMLNEVIIIHTDEVIE